MADKKDRQTKKKKDVGTEVEKSGGFQVSRMNEFAADVKNEFGKIVWPTRKQTMGSTAVVIVLVMMISFYLGAVDLLLGKLIGLVLR